MSRDSVDPCIMISSIFFFYILNVATCKSNYSYYLKHGFFCVLSSLLLQAKGLDLFWLKHDQFDLGAGLAPRFWLPKSVPILVIHLLLNIKNKTIKVKKKKKKKIKVAFCFNLNYINKKKM
jgi:hypothetical protein